jgi:ceramide glucosyltransferase
VSFAALTLLALLGLHLATVALLIGRRTNRPASELSRVPVSLVRPICGLDAVERQTIASSFTLAHTGHEIIFCCAKADDPAVPFVEDLIRRHPHVDAKLLIGVDRASANPKLDNIAKGWRAARYDWVVFADSNLLLPPDYLAALLASWRSDTGLVCAPPIGTAPESFWAGVECAWLNTYQARWQYAGDGVDYGFAQGKTMLWRRQDLMDAGGIAALSRELAEDAAATMVVRGQGRKVRLAEPRFFQPLGRRTMGEVLQRQIRWSQLRRLTFPVHYALEILTTSLWAIGLAAVAAAVALDDEDLSVVALAAALTAALWYGSEFALAWRLGWWGPLWSLPAMIVRDLLIPVVWVAGWAQRSYVWRGNNVQVANWSDARQKA